MYFVFSVNGVIGKSGQWYPTTYTNHVKTQLENIQDAPFVVVHADSVEFEAYYTVDKSIPTNAQYETLMNYCTFHEVKFEDMTDCWNLPWQKWRQE